MSPREAEAGVFQHSWVVPKPLGGKTPPLVTLAQEGFPPKTVTRSVALQLKYVSFSIPDWKLQGTRPVCVSVRVHTLFYILENGDG